jgi:hypothetical protein
MILAHQRCLNHIDREAVARCPECKKHFCRECISEHDDRVLCASCLRKLLAPKAERPPRFQGVGRIVLSFIAIGIVWFAFFIVGRTLLAIPATFHDGTIWRTLSEELK